SFQSTLQCSNLQRHLILRARSESTKWWRCWGLVGKTQTTNQIADPLKSCAFALPSAIPAQRRQSRRGLMSELFSTRREMMAVPLFAAAFAMFRAESVKAAGVDPSMTMITPPDQIPWQELYNFPKGAAETAPMVGKVSEPGQYFVLIRWHPGFMSAPHWYESDRLCVVLSGTWWCASGEDFAPEATVPVKAGSFVR